MSRFSRSRISARKNRLLLALAIAAAAVFSATGVASAAQPASTYPDYCLEQCNDILPPGAAGNATLVDILGFKAFGTRPANFSDQLAPYSNLIQGAGSLTNANIGDYYDNSSFGFPSDTVNTTVKPRSDVTINYDKLGIPHIYGTTRSGTEFGAGWAGAKGRLFVMDAFRHLGRGKLSSFAGGALGNRLQEQNLWQVAPYTEADLQQQVAALEGQGARGATLRSDVDSFLDGVNAYIDQVNASNSFPGEYDVTGQGKPQHFTETDLIAIADVIGGLFGNGGGQEIQSALVRISAQAKYGVTQGDKVWRALREQNDPEATTTIHNGTQFPYSQAPADASSVAMPDAGSVQAAKMITSTSGSGDPNADQVGNSVVSTLSGLASLAITGFTGAKTGMSNAAVVSGSGTTDGHPVAVMGPQTGYFSPQLLFQEELQGPGLSARGVAFAGLNFYVEIGRGPSYSWSPTSSEHDMADTYALTLCDPAGGTPSLESNYYLYEGTCTAMEALSVSNSWSPTLADSTTNGSYSMTTYRTKFGLVAFRGKVGGKPTAFAVQRSTYLHDADSVIGFQMLNDPTLMKTAQGFQSAAANIDYAFNWFYVNSAQTSYYDSGRNPVRAAGVDPNLPIKGEARYLWQGYNAGDNSSDEVPATAHPNSINQDYYVSWNNKQAPGFSAADGNFSFGSVQRVDLLDKPIKAALASGQKFDRAKLAKVVETAATTDLRAKEVLPELIEVLKSQSITDSSLASTVAELQAWLDSGALRVETSAGSKAYSYAHAIQVFDAWWPLLVDAEFKGTMGGDLYQSVVNAMQINESPSGGQNGQGSTLGGQSTNQAQKHKGSAFQYGWWGYVDKDLRGLLGKPVTDPLPVSFCGGGVLSACRGALLTSLQSAVAQTPAAIYPVDTVCSAGDQWCADAIQQSPLGGINEPLISWQNRPTYQQVVSYPAAWGDDVSNLALKKSASATSYNNGLLGLFAKPPSLAVDGDPSTYWQSASSDSQSITVDLGSAKSVARAIARWGDNGAAKYTIQVSSNNSSWSTVATNATGRGGVENLPFATTTARYVRLSATGRRDTSKGYSLDEFEVYAK